MRNIKSSKSKANQAKLEENDDKKRFVLLLELLLGSLSWHLGISYDFSYEFVESLQKLLGDFFNSSSFRSLFLIILL